MPGFGDTIEDQVDSVRDGRLAAFVAAMADVEAADTGVEFGAVGCPAAVRTGRDPPHGRGEECAIADAGSFAVAFPAGPEDRGDIGLRRFGKPEARHQPAGAVANSSRVSSRSASSMSL